MSERIEAKIGCMDPVPNIGDKFEDIDKFMSTTPS